MSDVIQFKKVSMDQTKAWRDFDFLLERSRCYPPPLTLEEAMDEIKEYKTFFVCLEEEIVGKAAYRIREDGEVDLSNIVVHPGYRRRGIARKVMLFLIEQNQSSDVFELSVHPFNQAALSLYASFGFEKVERVENLYGDGEPRWIMRMVR